MAQHSDIADKGVRLEGPLLLPVLEYGEFIELRRVARVLHDIGGCAVTPASWLPTAMRG